LPERSFAHEEALVASLRAGDRAAFAGLVDSLHARLVALARTFTSSPALAEDIVQETWLAVIRGLHRFEGRSTLRTWIFNILVRRARTMASREARRAEVPIPTEGSGGAPPREWEPGKGRQGLWDEAPVSWGLDDPEAVLRMRETLEVVERAVAALPGMQGQVVLLRDVEDIPSADVCNILHITETNLRVLLHRGRARIRRALDEYVRGGMVRPTEPRADAAGTVGRATLSSARSAESRGGP